MSLWSDESYWEATVVAAGGNDTGEVIGSVKQNISSFDSKWFLGHKDMDENRRFNMISEGNMGSYHRD